MTKRQAIFFAATMSVVTVIVWAMLDWIHGEFAWARLFTYGIGALLSFPLVAWIAWKTLGTRPAGRY